MLADRAERVYVGLSELYDAIPKGTKMNFVFRFVVVGVVVVCI